MATPTVENQLIKQNLDADTAVAVQQAVINHIKYVECLNGIVMKRHQLIPNMTLMNNGELVIRSYTVIDSKTGNAYSVKI